MAEQDFTAAQRLKDELVVMREKRQRLAQLRWEHERGAASARADLLRQKSELLRQKMAECVAKEDYAGAAKAQADLKSLPPLGRPGMGTTPRDRSRSRSRPRSVGGAIIPMKDLFDHHKVLRNRVTLMKVRLLSVGKRSMLPNKGKSKGKGTAKGKGAPKGGSDKGGNTTSAAIRHVSRR